MTALKILVSITIQLVSGIIEVLSEFTRGVSTFLYKLVDYLDNLRDRVESPRKPRKRKEEAQNTTTAVR